MKLFGECGVRCGGLSVAFAPVLAFHAACGGAKVHDEPVVLTPLKPLQTPAESAFLRGVEAAHQNLWEQAARAFAETLRLQPNHSGAVYNHAVSLERSGRIEAAVEAYRDLYRNNPADTQVAVDLARAQLITGDMDAAEKFLVRALKAAPQDARILNALASVLRKKGRFGRAAEYARQVLLRDQKGRRCYQNPRSHLLGPGKTRPCGDCFS